MLSLRKCCNIVDNNDHYTSIIPVNADKVECDADHSVPYLDSEKSDYSVWCGSEGVYLCEQEGESIECPTCYGMWHRVVSIVCLI